MAYYDSDDNDDDDGDRQIKRPVDFFVLLIGILPWAHRQYR